MGKMTSRIAAAASLLLLSACMSAEAKIKSAIADANYCESPSDCVDVGGKCPFDCYIFVHRSEVDRIKPMVEGYNSTCIYSCIALDGVDCVEGKCQPLHAGVPPSSANEEGNVGAACETHAQCQTPMTYLSRSVCPFGSRCIDGTCVVVCPMNEPPSCSEDSDCDCGGYAANDDINCKCVDEVCVAVVKK